MTANYTEKPSWFYKPIQIDNLEEIQKELVPIIYNKIPNSDISFPKFIIVQRHEIQPVAPIYTNFIRSLGILDKWIYSAIISTNNNVPSFPIHIDSDKWLETCYGLNIPVLNCEESYTVWYNAEIEYNPNLLDLTLATYNITQSRMSKKQTSARMAKNETSATEIARWHMKDPAWINVSIPHRPVSNHSKFRAVLSARFEPELHDLLYI
jgi:hypothetical protein